MRAIVAVAIMAIIGTSCGETRRVGPGDTTVPTPTTAPTAVPTLRTLDEIMRSGRIRVGFNMHQIALVQWGGSRPTGVHWELAEAMARELGVSVDWSLHYGYEDIFAAGRRHEWDVAFAVVDRTQPSVEYSNPYIENEWTYLVPRDSPVERPEDADRSGYRIAMFGGTEFQKLLAASLKHATIVPTRSTPAAIDLLQAGEAEVVAGSRNELGLFAGSLPDGRLLTAPAMKLRWSIAVASGQTDLLGFASDWVERAKASGLVPDAITRNRLRGISVAPPGP